MADTYIDAAEFEAAQRDPKVKELLAAARAYGEAHDVAQHDVQLQERVTRLEAALDRIAYLRYGPDTTACEIARNALLDEQDLTS